VERNVNKPYLGLRIAGQEFPRVRGEPAPEMAGRVAAEIKEKYWSDVFIRFFSHPLTLRLVREEAPHEEPPHEDAPHADQSQRATD
jgi:hypothetical protein